MAMEKKKMQKPRFGFVTMTFDCCHQGHFDLLRGCKMRCQHLIVGLTTDERARAEKRQTILSYDQRFAILSNCKWVDEVVPNHGDPKAVSFEKLHFDILFSGDDYFGSDEFKLFHEAYPNVPTVYIQRHLTRSSSLYIDALMTRFYASQQIIAPSIYSYIFRQGYGKPFHVTKCLPFSRFETRSEFACDDVFGFYKHSDQLPRNWKSPHHAQQGPQFPMISGIHTNRELLINMHFRDEPWCTYLSHSTIYRSDDQLPSVLDPVTKDQGTLLEFANFVARERGMPCKIVQMVQKDAGITMDEWCKTVCTSQQEFDNVVHYVEHVIITALETAGVVHSDIHPRNVMIDLQTKQVSLIDFGWVTAFLFELCPKERKAAQEMIHNKFDKTHFRKSLLLSPNTVRWVQKE